MQFSRLLGQVRCRSKFTLVSLFYLVLRFTSLGYVDCFSWSPISACANTLVSQIILLFGTFLVPTTVVYSGDVEYVKIKKD